MGVGTSTMRQVMGQLGIAANVASSRISSFSKQKEKTNSGKDAQMATKARKIAQQKINAIYANKELSNKARTRRIGKLLDEYKGGE